MLNLKISPQKKALLAGFDNEVFALLQVTSDTIPTNLEQNNRLNLAIVIDRSGSMRGKPLEEAKKSAIMMVEQMNSADRISIVTYHSRAELIVPSTLCNEKQSIISKIKQIREGGMTALHDGWLMGAEEVARYKSDTSLNRVLLLSDGNANEGLSDLASIKSQCAQLADASVTTSTYGLGHHFNEQLMIGMAQSGLGQGYYGETSEDLADPFREEFELLLNTVASKLHLEAFCPSFVNMELLNNFRTTRRGWSMPDIAEGGEGWALFRLEVKELGFAHDPVEVLRCIISFTDREGVRHTTDPVKLVLEPLSPNAFEAIPEDTKVKSRASELIVAAYQEEAHAAARRGDWEQVDQIIAKAENSAVGDLWMTEALRALQNYSKNRQQEQFSKEALYSAEKMNKRLVSNDESFLDYSRNIEAEKAAYLRRKTERGKRM
jgi:Ca-activated chloride channel family protein